MPLIRGCSGLVIRCFRRVEHFADAVTGAAGPVFVFLAWFLTLLGGIVFFDVVARDLALLPSLILAPIYIIVPINLYGQYYLVTHVPPGYPSPRAAGSPSSIKSAASDARWLAHDPRGVLSPERWGWGRKDQRILTGLAGEGRRVRRCRKCDGPKPERTHHCSVCKRCVLLMDHHCPWINACVGLHNQRHFVLFMAWLSVGCWLVLTLGYHKFWDSLHYRANWPAVCPRISFTLVYILSIAIGVAVPVLCGWHLYMVSRGETSIESHDNTFLEGKARDEGLVYLNPYDLGRRRNLQLFFNVGPGGYPVRTMLFPLLVPPYSNGWAWPRRSLPMEQWQGMLVQGDSASNADAEAAHESRYIMGGAEDLTDDEEGGGGYWE